MPLVKSTGSTQRDTPTFHPLRPAILEKMPLVERGGPQVDEEAKESKEAAPVSTDPQVRPEAPEGRGLGGLPFLALVSDVSPRPQSS